MHLFPTRLWCTVANMSVEFPLAWIMTLIFPWYSCRNAITEAIHKCTSVYFTLENHTISFCCCHYFATESDRGHEQMQYELCFVTLLRLHHTNIQKSKTKSLKCCNWNSGSSDKCIYFLFHIICSTTSASSVTCNWTTYSSWKKYNAALSYGRIWALLDSSLPSNIHTLIIETDWQTSIVKHVTIISALQAMAYIVVLNWTIYLLHCLEGHTRQQLQHIHNHTPNSRTPRMYVWVATL